MSAFQPFTGSNSPALVPWSDDLGRIVFDDLDLHDFREAGVVRGEAVRSMTIWADWRSVRSLRIVDVIAVSRPVHGARPFAVFAIANTGIAGVAEASLLTRAVPTWGREIARLAVHLRRAMPAFCADLGIHRIEARSWAGHPTGGRLLEACGLRLEARLSGFGASGQETFDQHAWTSQEQHDVS